VAAGETLGVKVSTHLESTSVTAEIFRIGDYGGAGARKLWSGGPWQVSPQPECPRDPVTSRIECAWKDTFTVPIGASWLSGLYVVKIWRADRFTRFAPFVVRDRRPAEILYTPNFTTYQAYNTWGGESLYYDGSKTMPNGRAWEVSFNRPYADLNGKGKTFHLDQYLIRFLEHHGYDVTYGTQLDFIRFPDMLQKVSAFVHGGHDEYWPEQERDQVDAALATGKLSLVYFGANGGYWRIRLQPDAQGHPLRTIACYKNEPQRDPLPFSTVRFRDAPRERAENTLFGSMYEGWLLIPYPLAVSDASHWLFEGTGIEPGTIFPGLVGYEYDKAFTDWPGYPEGVRISMKSPVVSAEGLPSYSNTVDRTLPSGRLVFSAGTIYWARGLADTRLGPRNPRLERMTLNVLERALEHRRPRRTLSPVTEALPMEPAPQAQWAEAVQAVAGQEGETGWRDGPAEEARFASPTGLAVTPEGHVVVADTRNNRIRLIQGGPGGTVITLAGNGELGYRDGEGTRAMFRNPTDVAVGPAGEIYVADSGNHVLRRLERTPSGWQVSTWAGKGYTPGFADGPGAQARFSRPLALAVDVQGNLYVADQENHRIRKCLARTREVLTLAGSGAVGMADAARGTDASFAYPSALALGKQGELYVLDAASQHLRRISANAQRSVRTIAGLGDDPTPVGFRDGAGPTAQFRAQLGMKVGPQGEVWLADTGNFRIRKILPGDSPEATQVFTLAGSGRSGTALGRGDEADIAAPTGLARDEQGRLYVSDSFHHVIRRITP
jgi:DNA-binding beta-propeller fold protein YncE